MANFASLKKTSSDLSRLTKEIEKINAPQSNEREEDTRFWKLSRDKSGNGSAVIRFLPAPAVDGDDGLPWVRYFDHGFKGPTGKWYIENSLTTIGQKDPVSEYNSQLWNASTDDNSWQRKQARDQKRRLHYIANILVVKDPSNPENEGKVFLFKFGKKIFDKITLAMNPEYEGDVPVNPFDLWKGANFKLRTRMVAGYLNYDQSTFDNPSALSDDDDELEKIWKREYSLKEFTDPKNFKTYDELKKRLQEVLGETAEVAESTSMHSTRKVATDIASSKPTFDGPSKRKSVEDTPPFDTEEDEDLNYFKGLADD
jgi:hypothetical protein